MSNFSGLWSLELIHSLLTWFTVRLKARTQGPEKFDIFSTKSLFFDHQNCLLFAISKGSPQQRRLRRRLRMSIAESDPN